MLKKNIARQVSSILEIEEDLIIFSSPQSAAHGNLSIPCFKFAKILKRPPNDIADELCTRFQKEPFIEKTSALNGYFNIFLKKNICAETIRAVLSSTDYGSGHTGQGKKMLIEHTSINPNASPHIGRGRNAMIGNAIANLFRFEGYKTDVHYFVNDIGKQIAILTLETSKSPNVKFEELLDIYITAQDKAKNSPDYSKEVYSLLSKLEKGDRKVLESFTKIVDTCMKGQIAIFNGLGIKYDQFDRESEIVLSGKVDKVLSELKKSCKVFKDEEGRWVLNLTDSVPEAPYMPLTRADGSSLYPLRDIAYTIEKLKLGASKNIVVLGQDQKVYYKQISVALNILGYYDLPKLVCYQFVKLVDGKMSTRNGKVVLLEDFKKQALTLVSQNLKERQSFSEEKAIKIANATVLYSILKCSPEKEVTFSWNEALSFEGNSALYIMYNYARIMSLLESSKLATLETVDFSSLSSDIELQILKQISEYPFVIETAITKLDVFGISKYVYTLTKLFSKYYNSCKIIVEDSEKTQAKLYLVKAVASIIRSGMNILGIELIDKI